MTTATNVSNGSYNTISNNVMRTTNSNSPGPTVAISIMGNTSNYSGTASNNTVTGNTIANFYYFGILNFYTNGNHIIKNDISRANSTSNNCYTQLYGIYCSYTYSSNRSTTLDANSIHDLPFAGASPSGSNSTSYYFFLNTNWGGSSTTNRFKVTNNSVIKCRNSGTLYPMYNYYMYYGDVTGNLIEDVNNNSGSTGYWYGIYTYYGQDHNISGNTIRNNTAAYWFYGITDYNPGGTWNYMTDNTIQGNKTGYYAYVMYPQYGNFQILRNKILNNTNPSGIYSSGYVYGLHPVYTYNTVINSNLISGNWGQYGSYNFYGYSYNSGSYSLEVRQNTINIDETGNPYPYATSMGIYLYFYYHTDIRVVGNIVNSSRAYYAYMAYTGNQSTTAYKEWDRNTYFATNTSNQYWYNNTGGGGTYADWVNTGFAGPNERFMNPNFRNASALDFRSDCFETQNNVPTVASNPTDLSGATRNAVMSDRGCAESFMDIAKDATNFTVPAQVCSGYKTSGGTTFTVKNLYTYDTAYNFDVAYSLNGGPKITEKVTTKILTNGTGTVTFNTPIQLNKTGNARIAIFIDIPDDNRSNDSFIFNTFVKPAPGGSKFTFSSKPTKALYQYGKVNDVTQLNQPVIYDLQAPRAYVNGDYGTTNKWYATAWAVTQGGQMRPASEVTLTAPAAGKDLEVQYKTSSTSMEDTMITLNVRFTDVTNNCDTVLTRKVLIYPTVTPDFAFPAKICDGDAVPFDNKSLVKSGSIAFRWTFGTGNPADTSEAPDPVFQFPSSGSYTVKMVTKTQPYGFEAEKSYTITVNQIPKAGFAKINACIGTAVQFTNTTTPASLYTWEFGDATTSNATSPSHNYPAPGAYNVTLKANLNGCISEVTQRVYQFVNPVAKGKVIAGNCDNEEFEFENTSSIANGLFGSMWDFADGNVSTEEEPEHNYATSGVKGVMLTTTSEFGCKDTQRIWVNVKESPKVNFSNTAACSIDPTQFTNLTPSVANALVTKYTWNFGDGGSSNAESPSHVWGSLGPKTVVYTIELDNGCKGMMTKNLTVGVQPQANFSVTNVCAGDPAVFDNNTTWSQGDISFSWNFGDNTSSTNSDPTKMYNVTSTTTYNVELTASIAGGCSNSITKPITINEGPTTCDFVFNTDYAFGFYGIKLDPINGSGTVGGQTGVEYTWVFTGGGTDKTNGSGLQKDLQTDGTYEVTMRAKVLSTGCMCTKTKTVVMNRTAVEDLEKVGVALYPNPNAGNFNIALTESFGANVKVEILTLTGAKVKEVSAMNNGLIQIEGSEMMNGVYLVRISSGEKMVTKKITVQK